MTLTDALTFSDAAPTTGAGEVRRPITDVASWLSGQDEETFRALSALGELLAGVTDAAVEDAAQFTARCLDVSDATGLINEQRALSSVSRLTTAVALAEWIDQFDGVCEFGTTYRTCSPLWTQTEVGGHSYRHPLLVRVYFPAGTLSAAFGVVVMLDARPAPYSADIAMTALPEAQAEVTAILDRLALRAAALNPYRGRVVRASFEQGLRLDIIDAPSALTRTNVIVSEEVWAEVDLGIAAVRDQHELLNAHGLGARRGVLLCGPPGTGKSAVSAVVAGELVGDFTVIYVEARAGAELLTDVVEEAQRIGGPVLLILEDVDLWCRDRAASGGAGLSELLQAMDIAPEARILTLASTNDAATLDKAAIRTGRFDSVVEVGYPNHADAAHILAVLVAGLPGGPTVDHAAVAAALPAGTSGSDLREIVRRAVLAGAGQPLTTAILLAELDTGRYRADVPDGMYL